VRAPEWFEVDEELDDIQSAFASALRVRAARWPHDPAIGELLLPDYVAYGQPLAPGETSYGRLLVVMDLCDAKGGGALLTVGAYLNLDHVAGDILHNQLYTLPRTSSPLAFQDRGDPAALGDQTASWLEELFARPITRDEWLRGDEVHAFRYVLTGLGPIVEGHVRTKELGSPDRVTAVQIR
jgi:hypothetical protein